MRPLAGSTLLTKFIVHLNFVDQMQSIQFMKDLSVTGGFQMLAVYGAGTLALHTARRLDPMAANPT